jgi:hypothetical protein
MNKTRIVAATLKITSGAFSELGSDAADAG